MIESVECPIFLSQESLVLGRKRAVCQDIDALASGEQAVDGTRNSSFPVEAAHNLDNVVDQTFFICKGVDHDVLSEAG